jgi:hypothetical protein
VSNGPRSVGLADSPVPIRVQLSALWASVTLCYLYCDYFELYQPGKLSGMLAGQMGPMGPTTQGVLLGASIVLAVPAVLVALCLLLSPRLCRGVNVVAGVVYTAIMLLLLPRVWHFYQFFATVEIALTGGIVWRAWRWPRA